MRNHFTWVTVLLIALSVVLAAVGCLLGSAANMAGEKALYGEKSREYAAAYYVAESEEALTAFIGLTRDEQEDYARQAADYMTAEGNGTFQPVVMREGASVPVLSEKEAQHMQDVRGLVRKASGASKACNTMAAALIVAAAWTGLELEKRRRTALIGAILGIGVLALAGVGVMAAMNTNGFSALFYSFHELAFTNDLWLMNPQTDILIRMMPETLFAWAAAQTAGRAAAMFGVVFVMLAAVYVVVDGILKRNMQK